MSLYERNDSSVGISLRGTRLEGESLRESLSGVYLIREKGLEYVSMREKSPRQASLS